MRKMAERTNFTFQIEKREGEISGGQDHQKREKKRVEK